MIKPLLFGYIRPDAAAAHARPGDVGLLRTAMIRFAEREGFTLGQVFVETRTEPPWVALTSLLEAARYHRVAAVVVPDRGHLGHDRHSQDVTRRQLESVADSVITMRLDPDL